MAAKLWALLLLGTLVSQHSCQHWSYGLSPGGKRALDSISDTLDSMVADIPHVDSPCSLVSCAESPLAKMYRLKAFLDSVTDRENGHRTYKK